MAKRKIVEIEDLQTQHTKVLRAIKKEGEKHLQYYRDTMSAFSKPENRIKTFDTIYYERVLPHIEQLLNEKS